jgi:hypothetical protein
MTVGEVKVWRLSDGNATVGEGEVQRTTTRFGVMDNAGEVKVA